ncbi:MAG TPA: tetratricopeptide repeat protein [Caldimonas sp.]|nr:tetratricopeptide repeat protein [Caldimonas sp.]
MATAQLWRAHDRLARDLLRRWQGREIDKSDGLLALFDEPHSAVGFATAYHAQLAALPVPLKARIGIDAGPVVLRENSPDDVALGAKPLEVDGVVKSIAARVMSIALGGQTLVTAGVKRALSASVGLRVQSHGYWRLKGIREPIEVFEAGPADSTLVTPPDSPKAHRVASDGAGWLPVARLPNNLPQETSSFVGRAREVDQLHALLESTRLLTLVGMGGLGKTRMLLRAAREAITDFPDGVWLVELAALADADAVLPAVCRALAVKETAGETLDAALVQHVRNRRILLLLDNCEHLIDACAPLVDRVLRAGGAVKVMASSREPLHVPGEQLYAVPPLRLSEARQPTALSLLDAEAAWLFVERARAVQPDFAITDDQAPLVAEVCRRLDGIPLAIELAAARMRATSLAELARGLDRRMRLLTGGARTAHARQQTLRATLDWSHDLLTAREQVLLRRLAVFVGGWWLDAARSVCAGGGLAAHDVPDLLASLVDKSWVAVERGDDATRYRLLETIREYARERLGASGDLVLASNLHQACFLSLAEEVQNHFLHNDTAAWMSRLHRERDNLFAALAWSAGAATAEVELRLAATMRDFGGALGVLRQAYEGTLRVLQRPACQERTRWRSAAANAAASQAMQMGSVMEASLHAEEALSIARENADAGDAARAWMTLGGVASMRGDVPGARRCWDRALVEARRAGSERLVGSALSGLADDMARAGDVDGALHRYEENVQIWRQLGHRFNEALARAKIGALHVGAGRLGEARSWLSDALALTKQIGGPRHMAAFVVHNIAPWAATANLSEPAVLLYAALAALRPQADFSALSLDEDEIELLERSRISLGQAAAQSTEERGGGLGWESLLEEAEQALMFDSREGQSLGSSLDSLA